MKLKRIALGVLLSIFSVGFAMDIEKIKMPSAQILKDRLHKRGLDDVAKKTDIIEKLAGKETGIFGIAVVVLYCDSGDDEKSSLLEALLEEEPGALEKLESFGLYKPMLISAAGE